MTATIEFFPVDNGDMTLITLENGKHILVDVNIRKDADDDSDDTPDVAKMLRDRLKTDAEGRTYVDAFLLSHPDADHCRGLERHFHLGKPADWNQDDDKIFVREMWSSPIIFRRKADLDGDLCEDAEAWWGEARRRVAVFKKDSTKVEDGDRILILGEDVDGKTDDLGQILIKVDERVTTLCGKKSQGFAGLLLAPMHADDENEEDLLEKNNSSVVLRFEIDSEKTTSAGRFLTGGDADVAIWEKLWGRHSETPDDLAYNVLATPHHCSWRSLSYDSWSDKGEKATVCDDARSALAQADDAAFIISSSKEIKDDEDDPPCIRAKREYESIAKEASGEFLSIAAECADDVLLIEIGAGGPSHDKTKKSGGSGSSGVKVMPPPPQTDKRGGGRYASGRYA